MTTEERLRRRFSEEFRKEQVQLIETGKTTILEVSKRYEVKTQNIRLWMERYGKKSIPGRILITTGKDYDRIMSLEKENKKLIELIGRQQVELIHKDEVIRLAKDRLGEDFEKK